MQKFLFDINRDRGCSSSFAPTCPRCSRRYDLSAEERGALEAADIGLIYVLGANGQLLMHYAAFLGMPWADYIAAMRAGVSRHGPVRAGVYAMTTDLDDKVAGRMSLVFAGICSHAPGITGRAHMADPAIVERVPRRLSRHGASDLAAARPDALIVVAAEHFANFFMNNMPAFAVGMAESYEGPIEDPEWLGIPAHRDSRATRRCRGG